MYSSGAGRSDICTGPEYVWVVQHQMWCCVERGLARLCDLGTRQRYVTLFEALLWVDIAAKGRSRTLVVRH